MSLRYFGLRDYKPAISAFIKQKINQPQTDNLNTVPSKNPTNAPKPAFNAWDVFFLVNNISPKTAPIKGPKIIPHGGNRNIPNNVPIMQPMFPHFVPFHLLTPRTGRI